MKQLTVTTRAEWRRWLARNHNKEFCVWLVFRNKDSGMPTLDYEAAVEEALCYGWVDSIIKKLDANRYARKLTPRKLASRWSESNKRRVAKLMERGRITKFGLAKIEAAKRSGMWDKAARPKITLEIPAELRKALAKNKRAKTFFTNNRSLLGKARRFEGERLFTRRKAGDEVVRSIIGE